MSRGDPLNETSLGILLLLLKITIKLRSYLDNTKLLTNDIFAQFQIDDILNLFHFLFFAMAV